MSSTIDNLFGEHQAIRAHMKYVKESIRDWEAILSTNQSTSQVESVKEKQKNFIRLCVISDIVWKNTIYVKRM